MIEFHVKNITLCLSENNENTAVSFTFDGTSHDWLEISWWLKVGDVSATDTRAARGRRRGVILCSIYSSVGACGLVVKDVLGQEDEATWPRRALSWCSLAMKKWRSTCIPPCVYSRVTLARLHDEPAAQFPVHAAARRALQFS